MKKHRFNALIEKDEAGYLIATVPGLKSCFAQGRNLEELLRNTRDAIAASLEIDQDPIELELVGVQQIEVEVPAKNSRRARAVSKK